MIRKHGKPIDPYSTPENLATYLAPRHSDPSFVRAYVHAQFGTAPSVEWIAKRRAEAEAREAREADKYDRAYLNCIGKHARQRARKAEKAA